jgi:hypothetical protein
MSAKNATLPRLQVSENRRFLVTETGEPFFWLGDTAWELFHRLGREEAAYYFADRESKRFTIIQAVVLAEFDGLNIPNRYGNRPLIDNDPGQPDEAYFSLVDEYIRMAAYHHLYIGLLPTWGDKVTRMWGLGPAIFTPQNAFSYGRWLGERYSSDTNVIWILGGDRPAVNAEGDYRPVWRAMAAGIRAGVQAPLVMAYHPSGGYSSSEWLQDEPWLDVNMLQSGHGAGRDVPVWEMIARDFQRLPFKPVLDGEPNYEDHPVSPWPKWDPANGYFRDYDVRKQAYRSVLAGGCGVTYGHHSIWQFYENWREPVTHPDRYWRDGMDRPGARQMQYLRALIESRPMLTRIPDQGLIVQDAGVGGEHSCAARDEQGRYAFIYLPVTKPVAVNINHLAGPSVTARWYDPRSGEWSLEILRTRVRGELTFTPPGDGPDWVLVLDSIAS